MPLFDFHCSKCLAKIEVLSKYSDKPPVCPECGKEMVRMYYGSPALPIFKVRGFYTTDYLGKNSNPGR